MVFLLLGYGIKNNKESSPEIIIKGGKKKINFAVKSRIIKAIDYENTELFQSIANDLKIKIPYVKLGEKIEIIFRDKTPSKYELKDYILRENGTLKYNDPTIQPIPIKFNKNTASFILEPNLFVYLSSNSKDYEPGSTIRGFRLICNWANKKQEYAFIIKTDANKEADK